MMVPEMEDMFKMGSVRFVCSSSCSSPDPAELAEHEQLSCSVQVTVIL